MKIKLKEYSERRKDIVRLLKLRAKTPRDKLISEVSASSGIPIIVLCTFVLELEGPNPLVEEQLQQSIQFYGCTHIE